MKYDQNNEYYLVTGWFEKSGGIHEGSFYGACSTPNNYLKPNRVVLHGDDAVLASEAAKKQAAKIVPEELNESVDSDTGLTPFELENTEDLILDDEHQIVYVCKTDGVIHKGAVDSDLGSHFDEIECPICGGTAFMQLSECVSSGAIAAGPLKSLLDDPNVNKDKTGLPKRKPNRADGLGYPKSGTNFKKNGKLGKHYLPGFGRKGPVPTINQAGGVLGGRG